MAFSTLTGAIRVDASGVEDGTDEAEQEVSGFVDHVESAGGRMQSAGRKLTAGVSGPLLAMGGLAARQAASFDENMQQSIAVMGDVDDAMREDLEATAREVANTTTQSADEAAESFYFLASAGLDAAESMEALPQVAAFAEAGQMDMAEATDVATNVMSAYGYEADEMAEVTDRMTATVSNHNQTMDGMADAMSRVAPTAAGLGVDLSELNAAIGQLGDVGIQGQRAGTALNTAISQLSDETSPANSELEEMGVQVRDAEGEMLPLVEIIRQLEEAGADAGDMAQVFGTQAGPSMAALLDEGAEALEENTEKIADSEDATEEMAETQRETLNKQLAMARSNLNDVAITIGSDLLPMLSTLTQHATSVANRFQGLSDRQRQAIVVFGALGVAIPPVIWLLGTLFASAGSVAAGFGTMAGAANGLAVTLTGSTIPALVATNVALGPITVPVWAIIAAFGALVAAAGALYLAWDNNVLGIRDTTMDALSTVREWLDAAPGWLLLLLGPLGQLYYAWRENLFGIQDIVGTVFGWIGDQIDWLTDKIGSLPGISMGDDDVDVDEEDFENEGAEAGTAGGEAYEKEFEDAAAPEADAMMPNEGDAAQAGADHGETIKGEMTPEIRDALEDGVDGYVSDPDEIEDTPTEISGELFEAVSEQGGATAETLGVSEAEFQELMHRYDGGGSPRGSGSGDAPPADLLTEGGGPSQAGGHVSPEEIGEAVRDALDDLRLEALLNIGDRSLEDVIDDRVAIVLQKELT